MKHQYRPVNVSNRRRLWPLETPEAVTRVRNLRVVVRVSGIGKIGKGEIGPPVTSLTQRKRCFTSVFCEAVVSEKLSGLRSIK
uniref:SFRICE_021386 n=1 Tax=Spodoptera frugiperda TaxID=7108 RepID=A0A2H1VAW9_SPOFR